MDEATIYNWENDRAEPAVRFIPRIIRFLGYCPYTPGLTPGERLKLCRQGLGHPQEKMAQMIGVDGGTLRRLEAGRRPLAPESQGRIKAFPERFSTSRTVMCLSEQGRDRPDSDSLSECLTFIREPLQTRQNMPEVEVFNSSFCLPP